MVRRGMKETTKVPPSQDYALDSTAEQDSEKGDGDGKDVNHPTTTLKTC